MMYKWEEVGPIMEKYRIEPYWMGDKIFAAAKGNTVLYRTERGYGAASEWFVSATGETVMEAVMNCYNKIVK